MDVMFTIFVLLLLTGVQQSAWAYPTGSPNVVCLAPYPHHGSSKAMTDNPPFQITTDRDSYNPGQPIRMTISSNPGFIGYLLKVRRKSGEIQEALGEWSNCTDASITYMAVSPAVKGTKNCITHSDSHSRTTLQCTWTAPAENQGTLVISATIAYSYEGFYVDVTKELSAPTPLTQVSPTAKMDQFPTTCDCGFNKGCTLYPNHCLVSSTCSHMISYQLINESFVLVEMLHPASAAQYAVFGVSKDESMGQDFLVFCNVLPNGEPMVQTGYGGHLVGMNSLDKFITGRQAALLTDGNHEPYLACKFLMPITIVFSYFDPLLLQPMSEILQLRESNSLFLGFGPLYEGSFAFRRHVVTPMVSSFPITLATKDYKVSYFYGNSRNIKIHSTLMSVGWLVFAPLAHIIVAHFRPNLIYQVCKKTQIWFLLHVAFMVICLGVTIAGFVYILVVNNEWKENATPHGVLACVTVGLMLINFAAGIFRPDVDSKRRYVFNLLHSANGYLTRILSIVTIWLAITLAKLNGRFQVFSYVVIGVWTVLDFLMYLLLFLRRWWKYRHFLKYESSEGQPTRNRFVLHCPNVGLLFYGFCELGLFAAFIINIWLN